MSTNKEAVFWNYIFFISWHLEKKTETFTVVISSITTNPITIWRPKLKFDWLDFTNQGHKFWYFIGQSYLKITLEPIRTQNLGSLLMKLSQSNFNLRSPDCYLVRSYLIATVNGKCSGQWFGAFFLEIESRWKNILRLKYL